MLIKFESKSNRVKGIAFHPTRPWMLASLHNGVIQLLDYQMCTLLDRFEEHDGPVRGIDFHNSQPLFVSGGDDHKVKVWDYKARRCLFTLVGHLDYIRTVQFHSESPWIVSASDDQTIRVWNWLRRQCVTVLTGHNHYVMCARFHPKDDLVVSASLDQTVRVWDTSGLRKKSGRGGPPRRVEHDDAMSRVNADLFGSQDAVVKYVLEGHDRGVNWADFHPTIPLIVSGADDRQVKLWRMNETKAWEVDTLRGHTNNVSCVLFHPRQELVISNSEDRSIRVWDVSKQMGVQTYRREHDRFWVLAAHPSQNLLAAGHDSGLIVFKLERERPAFGCVNGLVYYVKDRYLRRCVLGSGSDVPVQGLVRRERHSRSFGTKPRTLTINPYNPAEDQLLVHSNVEGGSYELFCLNAAGEESKRGTGVAAAVFVARNRFAVLDRKSNQILIRNLQNETTKRHPVPNSSVDMLFSANTAGKILIRFDEKIAVYEPQSRRVLHEVYAPRVKYVVWSPDSSHVALLSKHQVAICTRNLKPVASVTEAVRVKSGVWDEHGAFIYTTHNHIKYLLPIESADSGIVRTLDIPVYALEARGSTLHALDREGKIRTLSIDPTEYIFKLAVNKRQDRMVLKMIRSGRLCGQAVISYLQKAGFPEVALAFVKDQQARFNLALECGNLEVALEAANALNTDECWHRLGVEALRQGNHKAVERAYQQTRNLERLSFLYLITGNTENLRKMLRIANRRADVMARFHNSLYLGDVEERVQLLEDVGRVPLAYIAAATHGLEETAERLRGALEAAGQEVPALPDPSQAVYLLPPTPLMREDNWPLLNVPGGYFDSLVVGEDGELRMRDGADLGASEEEEEEAGGDEGIADAWGGDDLNLDGDGDGTAAAAGGGEGEGEEGGVWGDDLDIDLGEADALAAAAAAAGPSSSPGGGRARGFVPPAGGTGPAELWTKNSNCAADHVAAGSFETAMNLLHRQVGFVRFEPLRELFMQVYQGARSSLPTLPLVPSLAPPMTRNSIEAAPPGDASLPDVCVTLSSLVEGLKQVYKAFQSAKFSEAGAQLDNLLRSIPLVVVEARADVNAVKELLGIVAEYKLAVTIELARQKTPASTPEGKARQLELAAYLTHCNLQPQHLLLSLNLAMSLAFKTQNFIHANWFATRMLELPEAGSSKNAALLTKAKKVQQISQAKGRNALTIDYDERNPFRVCAGSLTPIYKGSPIVNCPYTQAAYKPEFKDKVCSLCGMAQVGVECIGLVCSAGTTARGGAGGGGGRR